MVQHSVPLNNSYMHIMTKKKVYINQYPNNHHHHMQSHTLDKTQEQNHKKGQI